ncbi:N-acetyltransferase [Pseudoruegeria sp. HB172150]|uniref:GNAT family N-acetyltransferase n=1 Tax=Pseudoruegeria sp. HB172150 TaxID=2721164 RepID=UPI0015529040|nr:GNAT family N-acetyltransferase [Pseudoruegeria sp. HB172150]
MPDVVRDGEWLRLEDCDAMRCGDGYATYLDDGKQLELVAIGARPAGQGIGTKLLKAVLGVARESGRCAVRLTTTNDNIAALAFYQRAGFRLCGLRPGAVDRARQLKPGLPLVAANGLPIRDELELVFRFEPDAE